MNLIEVLQSLVGRRVKNAAANRDEIVIELEDEATSRVIVLRYARGPRPSFSIGRPEQVIKYTEIT